MPVDLRAAICAALDVPPPRPSYAAIHARAALQGAQSRRRRVRSMLAAATLVVAAAIFAGGCSSVDAAPANVASLPAPAPVPLST